MPWSSLFCLAFQGCVELDGALSGRGASRRLRLLLEAAAFLGRRLGRLAEIDPTEAVGRVGLELRVVAAFELTRLELGDAREDLVDTVLDLGRGLAPERLLATTFT